MVSYVVVFFFQPHTSLALSLHHLWHTLTTHTTQGLETAFERGEVSSWIDFFRRGALTPLYHDRFPKLSEELREALANGDEAAANLLSALNKVGCVPCANKNKGRKQGFPLVCLFSISLLIARRRLSRCVTHCRDFNTPRAVCKTDARNLLAVVVHRRRRRHPPPNRPVRCVHQPPEMFTILLSGVYKHLTFRPHLVTKTRASTRAWPMSGCQ